MIQQPRRNNIQTMLRYHVSQQQTTPLPATLVPSYIPGPVPTSIPEQDVPVDADIADQPLPEPSQLRKRQFLRIVAVLIVLGLVSALYFIWHTPPSTASSLDTPQQNFVSSNTTSDNTGGIRVYVVGAVRNPGVYNLPQGARIYDLLQAAGGTLPRVNLVALNLAAKLSDGQEVYVPLIGEVSPSSGAVSGTGGGTNNSLININTASVEEMRQSLHISKTSAQAIVDYRLQHGNYSSVDDLSQVLSQSIYNKIRAECTV